MLLSLPDNWSVNVAWICNQSCNAGRDKVTRILKELQKSGYMVKRLAKDTHGRITGTDWDVHPEPTSVQLETRTTEKPSSGKSDTTNKDSQEERELQTIGSSDDKPEDVSPNTKNKYTVEFEEIWNEKPNRQGANPKRKAFQAYSARLKEGHTTEKMLAGVKRYKQHLEEQQKMNTPFVMQMATFLGPDEHFAEQWTFNEAGKPVN